MSPTFPQVALGAKKAAVAEAFRPGVVTVLKVDGTELVSLALLAVGSVVELPGAAPCEAEGVGAAVMEFVG